MQGEFCSSFDEVDGNMMKDLRANLIEHFDQEHELVAMYEKSLLIRMPPDADRFAYLKKTDYSVIDWEPLVASVTAFLRTKSDLVGWKGKLASKVLKPVKQTKVHKVRHNGHHRGGRSGGHRKFNGRGGGRTSGQSGSKSPPQIVRIGPPFVKAARGASDYQSFQSPANILSEKASIPWVDNRRPPQFTSFPNYVRPEHVPGLLVYFEECLNCKPPILKRISSDQVKSSHPIGSVSRHGDINNLRPRLVVDVSRTFNPLVKTVSVYTPNVDNMIDFVLSNDCATKLDYSNGYHNVHLDDDAVGYLSFCLRVRDEITGLMEEIWYTYLTMCYGPPFAPSMFEAVVLFMVDLALILLSMVTLDDVAMGDGRGGPQVATDAFDRLVAVANRFNFAVNYKKCVPVAVTQMEYAGYWLDFNSKCVFHTAERVSTLRGILCDVKVDQVWSVKSFTSLLVYYHLLSLNEWTELLWAICTSCWVVL
jgi:hypothetical protein